MSGSVPQAEDLDSLVSPDTFMFDNSECKDALDAHVIAEAFNLYFIGQCRASIL